MRINCTWRIQVPFYVNLAVSVTNFNIPSFDTNLCPSDYLAIGSGSNPGSNLISRTCGSSLPPPVVITNAARGNAWINFYSDGFNQAPSFRLTYFTSGM